MSPRKPSQSTDDSYLFQPHSLVTAPAFMTNNKGIYPATEYIVSVPANTLLVTATTWPTNQRRLGGKIPTYSMRVRIRVEGCKPLRKMLGCASPMARTAYLLARACWFPGESTS